MLLKFTVWGQKNKKFANSYVLGSVELFSNLDNGGHWAFA
jgi:hypothetical protein